MKICLLLLSVLLAPVAALAQGYNQMLPAGTLFPTDEVAIYRGAGIGLTLTPLSNIWGDAPALNSSCPAQEFLGGFSGGTPECSGVGIADLPTGTSGHVLGLLDGDKTDSGDNIWTGTNNFMGPIEANGNPLVSSFNGRYGAVSLLESDVTGVLGYTPLNPTLNGADNTNLNTVRLNLGFGPNIETEGCVNNGPDCSAADAVAMALGDITWFGNANLTIDAPEFNNISALVFSPEASFPGIAAADSILFNGNNPLAGDTIAVNGQTVSYVANGSGASGCYTSDTYYCQIQLQLTPAATLTETINFLASGVDENVSLATYRQDVTNPNQIDVTAAAPGLNGNTITLSASSSAITVATPTLTGGSGGIPVLGTAPKIATVGDTPPGSTTITLTTTNGLQNGSIPSFQIVAGLGTYSVPTAIAAGTTITVSNSTQVQLSAKTIGDIPNNTPMTFSIDQPAFFVGPKFFEFARIEDAGAWGDYHAPRPSGAETVLVQQEMSSSWNGSAMGTIEDILTDNAQSGVFMAFGPYASPTGQLGTRNNYYAVYNKRGDGGGGLMTWVAHLNGGGNVGWQGYGGGACNGVISYTGAYDVPNTANAPIPQTTAPWWGTARVCGEGIFVDGVGYNLPGVAGPRNGPMSGAGSVIRFTLVNPLPGIARDGYVVSHVGYPARSAFGLAAEEVGNAYQYGFDFGPPRVSTAPNGEFITGKAGAVPYASGFTADDDSNAAVGEVANIIPVFGQPGSGLCPGYQPLTISSSGSGTGAVGLGVVSQNGSLLQAIVAQGGQNYGETTTSARVPTCGGSPVQPKLNFLTRLDRFFDYIDSGGANNLSGADANNTLRDVYYTQATGSITVNSVPAAALQASGSYSFATPGTNPTNGQTIILNGVTWSFVTSGATGNQTNIQATLTGTIAQLAADLNNSSNTSINPATYIASGTTLGITYDAFSAVGDSYTLAAGTYGGVTSGSALTGGVTSSLRIGNTTLTFVANNFSFPTELQIAVGTTTTATAQSIYNTLAFVNDGQLRKVNPQYTSGSNVISLTARTPGADGNNIVLSTTSSGLALTGSGTLTGGATIPMWMDEQGTGGGFQIGVPAGGDEGYGTLNVENSIFDGGHRIADNGGNLYVGASGIAAALIFGNATSGTVTLKPVTGALGSVTASLPANTGVLAELNLAQTWSATQTFADGGTWGSGGIVTSALEIGPHPYSLGLGANTTLPGAPSSTQCLHMSSAGAITTTGSDCGGGTTHAAYYFGASEVPIGPGATSSFQMQGLAGSITPVVSGNVVVTVNGFGTCGTLTAAGDGMRWDIAYGTGAAPSNGASATGTVIGAQGRYMIPAAATSSDTIFPFSITAAVSGLSLNTAYWLDLQAEASGATGCSFQLTTVTAYELM